MSKEEELEELISTEGLGDGGEVTGEMYVPSERVQNEDDEGTLNESVLTTLKRDLKAILIKCVHVGIPVRSNKKLLHDWDLWGPLLLCIILGILLHGHAKDTSDGAQNTIHFIQVFLLVWGGAAVVTINTQLLRGKVSFFQSVCTLGYCLLPLTIALLLSRIVLTYSTQSNVVFILRLVFTIGAMIWSSWGLTLPLILLFLLLESELNGSSGQTSLGFLSDYLPGDRKALAVYPIVLFYICIGCLILVQNQGFL